MRADSACLRRAPRCRRRFQLLIGSCAPHSDVYGDRKNPVIGMISSRTSQPPIISGPSSRVGGLDGNRTAREDFDPCRPQPGGSSDATQLNRHDVSPIVFAKEPPRILLLDATHAVRECHLELLRSIPALVETLASCADMYLHEEYAYSLESSCSIPIQERRRRRQSMSAIDGDRPEFSCSNASLQRSTIGSTTSGSTLNCIPRLCARWRFDS